MRITELLGRKRTVSFELFPARTPKAAAAQEQAIGELAALRPDFFSITFGAGGSTRAGSAELVRKLRGLGCETLAYVAAYGLAPATLHEVLDDYHAQGVGSVLAVRGDRPEDEGFTAAPDALPYASELVGFARARHPFCVGVAGYPEGHREAGSLARDVEILKTKVDRGADFVITQYCYLPGQFADYLGRVRAAGVTVPVIAGVMPIFSLKMMETLAALCGATIPADLRASLPADPEPLVERGIELATAQARELLAAGAAGLHIYTMNKSRSAAAIVKRLRDEKLI
jgi:methylenetetrahydrofolate reductase (NADPH)